jgi:hypothetical protein
MNVKMLHIRWKDRKKKRRMYEEGKPMEIGKPNKKTRPETIYNFIMTEEGVL